MRKKKVIKLSIPADNSMVAVARLTASALANRIGFDIEEIDDIKIAVAEASKYIIGKTKNDEIQISFHLKTNKFEIEIKDIEEEYKDLKISRKKQDYSDNIEMYVLKTIMDNFVLKSSETGCIIHMSKRIIKE